MDAARRAASTASAPFPTNGLTVSKDSAGLLAGESYCVRVRARSGRVTLSTAIWGDHTYIGNGNDEPSFNFTDFPVGAACSACNAGLPRRGRLLAPDPWRDGRRESALHLEADRGQAVLLGDRRQGPLVHDDRRLRVHAHPGLRRPHGYRSAHVCGRGNLVLLGRAARERHERKRRSRQPSPGSLRGLPEADDAARAARAPRRRSLLRAAHVRVDLDLRSAALSPAGGRRAELQLAHRQRPDVLDGLHLIEELQLGRRPSTGASLPRTRTTPD